MKNNINTMKEWKWKFEKHVEFINWQFCIGFSHMNKNIQIQDNNNWKKYIIENPYDLDSKNIEKFLLFSYKTWELDIRSFQNYLENPKYYDWIIKWENNLELTNRLNILWELVQELW